MGEVCCVRKSDVSDAVQLCASVAGGGKIFENQVKDQAGGEERFLEYYYSIVIFAN